MKIPRAAVGLPGVPAGSILVEVAHHHPLLQFLDLLLGFVDSAHSPDLNLFVQHFPELFLFVWVGVNKFQRIAVFENLFVGLQDSLRH